MEERPISDISYEQFLKEEKLMGSRCKQCDALYVPPRPICVECHSTEMAWEEMSGSGKLGAFTCIAIGPSFMRAQGYDRKNPYCSGVVELAEGARVDARIDGVDTRNPETIKIGLPLKVVDTRNPETIKIGLPLKVQFLHRTEDGPARTYLAFRPS
jgi:uncharacterized OB-fold protein